MLPTITSHFAGGNIQIDATSPTEFHLQPDLRDTTDNWFYWAFKITNAQSRTITFTFTKQSPLTARGPVLSLDNGLTWQRLPNPPTTNDAFTYTFPPDANDVLFALAPIYTQETLARFLGTLPPINTTTLCLSRHNRAVPVLHVGNTRNPQAKILITARHHACETMASFVLEGILQSLLDPASPWLVHKTEIQIIPFIDFDGVEQGDQGKNRTPRDHNRDYAPPHLYPETRAIVDLLPAWSADIPLIAFDLHCPWIRGQRNELVYQVGSANPQIAQQQQLFAQHLSTQNLKSHPSNLTLPYAATNDLPFGQDWNTDVSFAAGLSFGKHVASLPNSLLVSTFEIPYAEAQQQEVTPLSAQHFGQTLAHALQTYLTTTLKPSCLNNV